MGPGLAAKMQPGMQQQRNRQQDAMAVAGMPRPNSVLVVVAEEKAIQACLAQLWWPADVTSSQVPATCSATSFPVLKSHSTAAAAAPHGVHHASAAALTTYKQLQ